MSLMKYSLASATESLKNGTCNTNSNAGESEIKTKTKLKL